MKKFILCTTMITGFIFAESKDVRIYASPGIQIGLNSSGDFFYSFQISVGLYDVWDIMDDSNQHSSTEGLGAAITLGTRTYLTNSPLGRYRKSNMYSSNRYSFEYIDLQFSALYMGIGVGKIFNKNESFNKYKLWILTPIMILASYDYITFDYYEKHNFGLFGVLPLVTNEKRNSYYSN